ncbi:MAG: 50S ribosomal protein L6 [Nitrospinae bacterium]|nr:50S ribosomal protein L6 [Nitrospinota bacterium]
MSRIGKKPVELPAGVSATVAGQKVEVKGPKGALSFNVREPITVTVEGSVLSVHRPDDARQNRSLHGLTRALLGNMVDGVSKGFETKLLITGVGYRASLEGKKLSMSLGFSHPVHVNPPDGISFEVGKTQTDITVKGIDKALVGQVAANIRKLKESEPYKGKGIRYEDEVVRRKAGKSVSGGK